MIRTNKDRGVVIVLDKRLVSRSYGKKFITSLPPVEIKTPYIRQISDEINIYAFNSDKSICMLTNAKLNNDIKEFDSLNFVKLIIFLDKYSVQLDSEKLSKIKKIKDLINACEKNNK